MTSSGHSYHEAGLGAGTYIRETPNTEWTQLMRTRIQDGDMAVFCPGWRRQSTGLMVMKAYWNADDKTFPQFNQVLQMTGHKISMGGNHDASSSKALSPQSFPCYPHERPKEDLFLPFPKEAQVAKQLVENCKASE